MTFLPLKTNETKSICEHPNSSFHFRDDRLKLKQENWKSLQPFELATKSTKKGFFSRKIQNFLEKNSPSESSYNEIIYSLVMFDNFARFCSIWSFFGISEDGRGICHSIVRRWFLVGGSSSWEIDSWHWIQQGYGGFGLRWRLWLCQ